MIGINNASVRDRPASSTAVRVTAAISGLVDVDAVTLLVRRAVGDGVVGGSVAGMAVFLAAAVDHVIKLGLLWLLDSRSLALKATDSGPGAPRSGGAFARGSPCRESLAGQDQVPRFALADRVGDAR